MIKHTLLFGKKRVPDGIAKYVFSIPSGFEVKYNLRNTWHTTSGHLKVHKVDRYQTKEGYVE